MTRIFSLSFVMIVSLVSVCLAQPIEQNSQETWKTYQSQWNTFEGPDVGQLELRFNIKYPSNWFVVSDEPDGVVLANFSDEKRVENPEPGDMWIWFGAHTDTATHGKWVEIKSGNGQAVLWLTGCLNPLSIDLFVLKNDPNLGAHQKLLFDIGETLRGEKR